MRNDEQLIQDETESTRTELCHTAVELYEAIGPSAVLEWGHKIGLRFSPCDPCEMETPDIGDRQGTCCAVCGCLK